MIDDCSRAIRKSANKVLLVFNGEEYIPSSTVFVTFDQFQNSSSTSIPVILYSNKIGLDLCKMLLDVEGLI